MTTAGRGGAVAAGAAAVAVLPRLFRLADEFCRQFCERTSAACALALRAVAACDCRVEDAGAASDPDPVPDLGKVSPLVWCLSSPASAASILLSQRTNAKVACSREKPIATKFSRAAASGCCCVVPTVEVDDPRFPMSSGWADPAAVDADCVVLYPGLLKFPKGVLVFCFEV